MIFWVIIRSIEIENFDGSLFHLSLIGKDINEAQEACAQRLSLMQSDVVPQSAARSQVDKAKVRCLNVMRGFPTTMLFEPQRDVILHGFSHFWNMMEIVIICS